MKKMSNLFKKTSLAVSALMLTSVSVVAQAADNIQISANVVQSCVVTVPTALNFGKYDYLSANATTGADLNAQTTVNVQCNSGTPSATVFLGKGNTNATAYQACTSAVRELRQDGTSTTNKALYYLYKDSARTDAWGCNTTAGTATTGGKAVGPFTNSLTPIVLTVYSSVTKGQNLTVGNYTDTVNVWVAF